MNRKYLKDIGLTIEDIPLGFCLEEAKDEFRGRGKAWAHERKKYGFDSRETWSLDYTITLYLYERLSMYREKMHLVESEVQNIKNISYKEKDYTHVEIVNEILEGLKLDLILDEHDLSRIKNKEIADKIDNTLYLLALSLKDIEYIGVNIGEVSRDLEIDFEKEVQEYGFSQKEVWFLVKNLKEFIYNRLKMYDKITDGFIKKDTDFHSIEYKGEKLTFQDYIDKLLEGLELDIKCSDSEKAKNECIREKIDDVFSLLPLNFNKLWW